MLGSKTKVYAVLLAALFVLALGYFAPIDAHDEPGLKPHHIDVPMNPTATMKAFMEGKLGDDLPAQSLSSTSSVDCTGGSAGGFPCNNVRLEAFLSLADIGAIQSNDEANDIWGWTDPLSGREYAIVGRVFGTSFVDISTPAAPVYLGDLPTHGIFGSPWRDIKVYKDHAFIVSEASNHGMQVFDLTRLRGATPGSTFSEDAHYGGFSRAHNLVINEGSGYAYAVGSNTCSGGLEIVDIRDPLNPADAGCYSGDGYTHDAQCVVYLGPDLDHRGREICFASNEDTLTIVDVTNKSLPSLISRTGYNGSAYTHQGWLSEDQSSFYLDDELDEQNFGHATRTRAWDVSDLDNPVLAGFFDGPNGAIDHNLYVRGRNLFQANYRAGLRILEIDPSTGGLSEVGYFDIFPADDAAQFNAAWSNFPYFPSGRVVVSGIEQGLFVLTPLGSDLIDVSLPAPGSTVSGLVDIEILAKDAEGFGGLLVEWRLHDETQWSPTQASGDPTRFSAQWDTLGEQIADGNYGIVARMTEANGQVTTDMVVVKVENGLGGGGSPPSVDAISPSSGTVSGNVELSARVSDDGTVLGVEFFDGSLSEKLGDASFNGTEWTLRWNTRKETSGDHTIIARATDDEGLTGEASVILTVGGGGGGGGGEPGGGGPGGDKCFKNKEPLCP